MAIDELRHGTPVRLGACAGQWCAVTVEAASGYIDRDALSLPRPPANVPGAAQGAGRCFTAAEPGYRGSNLAQFCQPAAPPTR